MLFTLQNKSCKSELIWFRIETRGGFLWT